MMMKIEIFNLGRWIDCKVKFVFLCKVKAQTFLEESLMKIMVKQISSEMGNLFCKFHITS